MDDTLATLRHSVAGELNVIQLTTHTLKLDANEKQAALLARIERALQRMVTKLNGENDGRQRGGRVEAEGSREEHLR